MPGDDGTPAGVDAVLRATMEYGKRRIKDAGQRLRITVAMVPPKLVRQIEQECRRALKAEVRSERMEQPEWESLKYETVLTEQTFEAAAVIAAASEAVRRRAPCAPWRRRMLLWAAGKGTEGPGLAEAEEWAALSAVSRRYCALRD